MILLTYGPFQHGIMRSGNRARLRRRLRSGLCQRGDHSVQGILGFRGLVLRVQAAGFGLRHQHDVEVRVAQYPGLGSCGCTEPVVDHNSARDASLLQLYSVANRAGGTGASGADANHRDVRLRGNLVQHHRRGAGGDAFLNSGHD